MCWPTLLFLTAKEFEVIVKFASHVEMTGELTDEELLERVTAIKHPQAEEPQEDNASDKEPKELSLQEHLRTVDVVHRICQHCGFETDMKLGTKMRNLQLEVVKNKKRDIEQIVFLKLCAHLL